MLVTSAEWLEGSGKDGYWLPAPSALVPSDLLTMPLNIAGRRRKGRIGRGSEVLEVPIFLCCHHITFPFTLGGNECSSDIPAGAENCCQCQVAHGKSKAPWAWCSPCTCEQWGEWQSSFQTKDTNGLGIIVPKSLLKKNLGLEIRLNG